MENITFIFGAIMQLRELQRRIYELIASGEDFEIDEELIQELSMEPDTEDVLVDSILQIFVLATLFGIDLELAIKKKFLHKEQNVCA